MVRLFGARCAKCGVSFAENDLVMRARHNIYHVQCFQCVVCQRQLVAGDEFCQRGDDGLFCKADFDAVVECRADPAGTAAVTAGFTFDDNSAATTEQQLKLNNNNHGEGDAKRKLINLYVIHNKMLSLWPPWAIFLWRSKYHTRNLILSSAMYLYMQSYTCFFQKSVMQLHNHKKTWDWRPFR